MPPKRHRAFDGAADLELQKAAEEYLLEYHKDMLTRLERLPENTIVCFSNAIDPGRDVTETRTHQLLHELGKAGFIMEDYPVYGHQVHQTMRHAYVAPLPVRRALAKVLEALDAQKRLQTLNLKVIASGVAARRLVRQWQLKGVCEIPHWSEVYQDIDATYRSLSMLETGVL